MISLKNVMVATDFSEPSEAALRYGEELARNFRASLHLLHVVDDLSARVAMAPLAVSPDLGKLQTDMETEARRSLERLIGPTDRQALKAQFVVMTSPRPADAILSYARDAKIDLIVMGTHGRTGLSHFFMGSVAQHVVRMAPCPVLTVRHPEREFVQPDALQRAAAAR